MTARPKIPGARMTIRKARQRWDAVREAAQAADPGAMLDAVSRFQPVAEMMFHTWDGPLAAEARASGGRMPCIVCGPECNCEDEG